MSLDHVAVGAFHNHMSRPNQWLRRYALFFDRFEITDLTICLNQHRMNAHGKEETVRECEWLIERGHLAQSLGDSRVPESRELKALDGEIDRLVRAMSELDQHYQRIRPAYAPVPDEIKDNLNEQFRLSGEIAALHAERTALGIRHAGKAIATCLESPLRQHLKGVDAALDSSALLRFIVDDLPVPARRVPWKELLAFKADADSRTRLRSLRNWVGSTARGGISLAEASDRIGEELDRYRTHMHGAGIAYELATWEAVLKSGIVSPYREVEAWTKSVPARPFDVVLASSHGAQADLAAPGRELSYIVKIEDAQF